MNSFDKKIYAELRKHYFNPEFQKKLIPELKQKLTKNYRFVKKLFWHNFKWKWQFGDITKAPKR